MEGGREGETQLFHLPPGRATSRDRQDRRSDLFKPQSEVAVGRPLPLPPSLSLFCLARRWQFIC